MRTTKYEYHIQESPDYIAECNYTFGIWTRRILVRDCMRTVACSMKQTNFIFKMLTWIPLFWILSIGLFPKYKIYIGNQLSGETKVSFHTPKRNIVINDHIYELYLHNDNYVSIMMDERQIALVKKTTSQSGEKTVTGLMFRMRQMQDWYLCWLRWLMWCSFRTDWKSMRLNMKKQSARMNCTKELCGRAREKGSRYFWGDV